MAVIIVGAFPNRTNLLTKCIDISGTEQVQDLLLACTIGQFCHHGETDVSVDGRPKQVLTIFTSNIPNESEYKKTIPPELQTRFDLVCEFEEPTPAEKTQVLDLLLEKAIAKYPDKFVAYEMTDAHTE